MDVIDFVQRRLWGVYLGSALVLLALLYVASDSIILWPILNQLSRHSIAVFLVTLVVIVSILCIASIFAVPIWWAWLTDIRTVSKSTPYSSLRPVDLSGPRKFMTAIQQNLKGEKQVFHPTSEAVSAAMDDILSLIMRDFVKIWHIPLLSGSPQCTSFDTPSSHHFPDMVEATLRESFSALLERAADVDLAHLGMCTLLPTLNRHMKLFEEAESEWRRSPSAAEFAEGIEGDLFLAALYNNGILHPAVGDIASPDTKLTELAHLRGLAERAMKHVLPNREAKSNGVHIVVRELVACTVLKPIVDALSEPDSLNALLEEKAGAALQEQKLVSKLREALDKQGSLAKTASSTSSSSSTPRKIKILNSSETSYDSFMESIGQSKSILDARRIRNGLLQQIRKTNAALSDEEVQNEDRKSDLHIYLQRLQAAMEAVDNRMNQLGTTTSNFSEEKTSALTLASSQFAESVELRDVLTSSSAISYFLEFSEGRKCSIFVQFWLSVNTLKNPLEVADSDSEEENSGDKEVPVSTPASSLQFAQSPEAKTLSEDLSFFVETYYQSDKISKVVKAKYITMAKDYVQKYATGQLRPNNRMIRLIRKSVIRAQKQIYDELVEEEWPAFKKSPVWHRTVENLQQERAKQAPTVTSSSSFFLEHKDIERDSAPRPSTSRAVSHAHLFGIPDGGQEKSPTTSLFGEEKDEQSFKHLTHMTSSLDQLMGGKGVAFEGVSGRTPLFREALFDDEEGTKEEEEEYQAIGKEAFVQVDKVDALENVLAFIIEEDLPLNQMKSERPSMGKKRMSSANTSVKSRRQSPLFGEVDDATHLMTSKTGQNLPFSLSRNGVVDVVRIEHEIKRLGDQEELLAALIRKSELTGSSAKEMQLMQKSKTTIARELRELHFQKTTLAEQQQKHQKKSDIPIESNRVRIQILHTEVNHDGEGKEYASYLIEVSHLAQSSSKGEAKDTIPQSGWIVSRRYNEFYALHNRLKEKFDQVRALEAVFPGKRFNGLVNAAFLESRRLNLQRYLQKIVNIEIVCRSKELKRFLSQSVVFFAVDAIDAPTSINGGKTPNKGLVSRLYRGVTGVAEGLDDLLFGPSMYEVIIRRLSTGVIDLVGFNDMEKILAGATTSSLAEIKEATQAVNTSSFTGPLCDAIIELFQLKLEGNWFRKQAVIIVAQQALGGTIERRVRQSIAAALQPSALLHSIALVRNMLWPNGVLKKQTEQKRSLEEKKIRSENALKKLSTLIPSVASHFIGRDNARRAARMSWALLQNKRLNKHIIYTIMDQILDDLFKL